MTTPARNYSWPPFTEGNTVAMRHGARSPRHVQPIADALLAEISDVAPWAMRPAFAGEVAAWAHAEARCRLLRAWIDEHGLLSAEGLKAADSLDRAERRAANARQQLGLTPMALSRIMATLRSSAGNDPDASEDAIFAEGRAVLDARPIAPTDD